MTYNRYGEQYRWQFFQLLSFAGGPTQEETARDRFTLFPLYFQQRSSDPSQNYTAVFPFYGHLQNRLFRDEIFFVMWPLYSQTRKRDVVTDNYLVPVFHLRHGDGLHGWQFWPLVGNEHKEVTTRTNGSTRSAQSPGMTASLCCGRCSSTSGAGSARRMTQWQQASMPAYSFLRSPMRDSTTVIWPFFNYVNDREKKYREWDAPWPFVVFARGEGKTTTRVWPFFSQAHSATLESDFYLWPIYKYNGVSTPPPLDTRRTRICFFLYSDSTEKNTANRGKPTAGEPLAALHPPPRFQRQQPAAGAGAARAVFARKQEHRAQLLAALVALAFREQSQDRRHAANRCCGTCTAAKRRRRPKNARSCSGFSSINPVPKANACVCSIFR